MINTIFYFAPSLEEYQSKWDANEISPRTIVFIPPSDENSSGIIYKGGIPYGGAGQVQIVDETLNEFSHNAVENRAIAEVIFELQRQIGDINAKLTNITFSVEPQSVYAGLSNRIDINVSSDSVTSSIVIYRDNDEIYRALDSKTITYQDIISPSITSNIIYRAEITISGTTITKEVTVVVSNEQHLNVFVGHGTDYANAQFTDTNRGISNNMIISVTRDAGDYVFIKVDKRDNVNNLYTYPGPNMEGFEYVVALDTPIVDGDYKYYKTTSRYNAGEVQYKVNKI